MRLISRPNFLQFNMKSSMLFLCIALCSFSAKAQYSCATASPMNNCWDNAFITLLTSSNGSTLMPACGPIITHTPIAVNWYTFVGNGETWRIYTSFYVSDTELWVYDGTCGALNCITANDDFGGSEHANVEWATTAGTTYYIALGSLTGNMTAQVNAVQTTGTAGAPAAQTTDYQTACDSLTWLDGNTYTTAVGLVDAITFTTPRVDGCDSIIWRLVLTINSSVTGTDVQTGCGQYTWIDGITYTASDSTATHTLVSALGCDSVVTLNLTIIPNKAAIAIAGATPFGVDTFRMCVGDFAIVESVHTAGINSFNWMTNGAIPGITGSTTGSAQFNVAGFFQFELITNSSACGDAIGDSLWLYVDAPPTFTWSGDITICELDSTQLTVSPTTFTSPFIAQIDTITYGVGNAGPNHFRNTVVWSPLTALIPSSVDTVLVHPQTTTTYTATAYAMLQPPGWARTLTCPTSQDFVVTVNPIPIVTVATTAVVCSNDGSALATVTNSAGPYDFLWSDGLIDIGVSSSINTSLAAGSYTVNTADAITGCTAEFPSPFDIFNSVSAPSIVVQSQTPTCIGSSVGSVTVSTSGGTAPFNYFWADTVNGPSRTGLAAGTYTVTVTDASGCFTSLAVIITENANLTVVVLPTSAVCNGDAAVFTLLGQTGSTLTYNLGGANTTLFFTSDTMTVTDLNATADVTMQLVSVVNAPCSTTLGTSSTVTVFPILQLSAINNGPLCPGDSGQFFLTGTPGAEIHYTMGGNQFSTGTGVGNLSIGISGITATETLTLDSIAINGGMCAVTLGQSSTLIVNPVYNSTASVAVCPTTTYTYPDGFSQVIAGDTTHTSNLTSIHNCDSIIITNVTVLPVYNATENVSACENSTYTYPDGFSETITASTSHTSNLLTVSNCDSVVTTNVVMLPAFATGEHVTACENAAYTYPDGFSEVITASTSHTSNLLSINNCDSVVTTNVTLLPAYNIPESVSACENSTYTYPDGFSETITASTTHTSNLLSVSNCDSIIVTTLTLLPAYNLAENVFACENSTYTYPDGFSETITASTAHTSNLLSVSNCDSIIVTNVTMTSNFTATENITACENSQVTYPDGVVETILLNSSHTSSLLSVAGCDSIIITNVTMLLPTTFAQNIGACENSTFIFPDGSSQVITSTIQQSSILTGANGCDSTVVTNVTMFPSYNLTDSVTACENSTYSYPDGFTEVVTANTSHTSVFQISGLCDSTITTNVTMIPSTTATDTQTACATFTWIDGNTYTASNSVATHTLTNAAGCDSIVTLDLTLTAIDTSVAQNIDILTSNQAGAAYQWIDCGNGNGAILGETGQAYQALSNGDYAVVITIAGCSDTSACVNVNAIGIAELISGSILTYPNPTRGVFTIDLNQQVQRGRITVTSVTGKTVYDGLIDGTEVITVDGDAWSAGIYIIRIDTPIGNEMIKLVKE